MAPAEGNRGEGKRNFQAWIDEDLADILDDKFRQTGVTRTAFLEAMAEWMRDNPGGAQEGVFPGYAWVVIRARQITAERRQR